MSETTENLKRAYDCGRLLALAEQLGLATCSGRMQCPSCRHDDKRSCKVDDTPAGALWNCKRCDSSGSVLDLVMKAKGIDLHSALDFLGATPVPVPACIFPCPEAGLPADCCGPQ